MLGWLGVLIAGGALVAVSVSVLPYWPTEHKGTDLGIGVVMLPVGGALWVARRRAPAWVIHAGLLVGIGCITGAVWAVGPSPQTQAPALFYGFLSAFASAFLPRRLAMAYLGLAGAMYLGVLTLDWRAQMATQWAMGMVAITLPCAIISTLVGRLRALALRDPLTGLANRRLLDQLLPAQASHARRRRLPLSIAALDLDGLKTINDLAGHAAGDQLLISVARGFNRALRADDVLARIGGDEFILVLPGVNLAEAQLAVQRLRTATPGVAFSAGVVR
ncbi:MAG: GGDEF domain-containing protein, partial [Trebonia sp.]